MLVNVYTALVLLPYSQAILRMGLVCVCEIGEVFVVQFGSQFVNWFDQYKTFLIIVMLYSTLFDTLVSYSFCCVEIIEITLHYTCLHSSQFIITWV